MVCLYDEKLNLPITPVEKDEERYVNSYDIVNFFIKELPQIKPIEFYQLYGRKMCHIYNKVD
jgi:hypothetical protein